MEELENKKTSTKGVEQEGNSQETQEGMQSQLDVATLMNLRDMAAQVALNFAGQTIDSYDGTYTLLIDCIYDALFEIAQSKNMIVKQYFVKLDNGYIALDARTVTITNMETGEKKEVSVHDDELIEALSTTNRKISF